MAVRIWSSMTSEEHFQMNTSIWSWQRAGCTSRFHPEVEREYYQMVIGFQGDFLFAENLEEARLLVISGQGFLPAAENNRMIGSDISINRVPLFREADQITRNDCLFWKKENSGYYVEEFADMMKQKYKEL